MNLSEKRNTLGKFKTYSMMLFVFAASAITRIYYFTSLNNILQFPDSYEYLETAARLTEFKIDSSRVPLYPLLILIARWLFENEKPETPVVILQIILSSLSMMIILYVGFYLFGSWIKAGVVTVFTLSNIWLINWDFYVLTESFSTFIMSMFLLRCILYFKFRSAAYLWQIYLLGGVLIFIRPFYILLPVLAFLVLTLKGFFEENRGKVLVVGAISLSLVYTVVFAYSWLNFKQNGYFGTSDVSAINRMGKILQYRIYNLGDNEKIIEYIKEETRLKDGEILEPVAFIYKYDLQENNYEEVSKFTSEIIKKHPFIYLSETLKFILGDEFLSGEAFADYNTGNYKDISAMIVFNYIHKLPVVNSFRFAFILILAECLYLFYTLTIKRRVDWNWLMILLLVLYQIAMSIAGAHAEYGRLIVPVYTLIFFMLYKYIFMFFDGVLLLIERVKAK